jgi:hypothetical protein
MARKAKGWRNNRSDIPDEPGRDNPDHPNHDPEAATDESKPKRKAKQRHLPGLEPPSIPKIDKLADTYVEHRNSRMAKLEEETAAKDLLWAAMIEAGLKSYETPDGMVVEILSEEKIKVKKKKPESEDGDEADEE